MATPGYNYLIQIDTGTPSTPDWEALRIRGGQFPELTQVHGTVDITAHGDTDIPFRQHMLTLYEAQTITINVLSGGSTENQDALAHLRSELGTETGVEMRLWDGTTSLWQAEYLVTGVTLQAPLEDAVAWNVDLTLQGEPATHFGG